MLMWIIPSETSQRRSMAKHEPSPASHLGEGALDMR